MHHSESKVAWSNVIATRYKQGLEPKEARKQSKKVIHTRIQLIRVPDG